MNRIFKRTKHRLHPITIRYLKMMLVKIYTNAFADDLALWAPTPEKMQENMDILNEAIQEEGLKINPKKTRVMAIERDVKRVQLIINNVSIEQMNRFTYLGAIIKNKGDCNNNILARIACTSSLLEKLRKGFLCHAEVSKATKIKVFDSVYVPRLIHDCESWTLTQRIKSKIQACKMRFLRIVNKERNTVIRSRAGVEKTVLEKIEERQHSSPRSHQDKIT